MHDKNKVRVWLLMRFYEPDDRKYPNLKGVGIQRLAQKLKEAN